MSELLGATGVIAGAVVPGHLGGYVPGGDDATYYPELWEWLANERGVTEVIDVGCGDGVAVRYFRDQLGCHVRGYDGVPQDDPDIRQVDFIEGPCYGYPADLVWSCEFVEHVDEVYVPNFLSLFAAAPLVVMTHAAPGQAGHHHVNCRPADYWVGVLAAVGYQLDRELTALTRGLASVNPSPHNHYARSGLAFRRTP